MSQEAESEKKTLHFVEDDSQQRAQFAQFAVELGYHCELYDDLSELAAYPPRQGIIVLRDSPRVGGVVGAIDRLEQLGIWLSVIAIGDSPAPQKIVDAVKAGALDYLVLPCDTERLERCLSRTAVEARKASNLRRKKVEAQQKLETLSIRESEVLELLAAGQSNKLIARELGISPRTVEIHRSNMMLKLNAKHAASAVRIKLEANPMALSC